MDINAQLSSLNHCHLHTKYIPLGCLHLYRPAGIAPESWSQYHTWIQVELPRDVGNTGSLLMPTELRNMLCDSRVLRPYYHLHMLHWIRLEYRSTDKDHSLVRVYVLPNDIERSAIDRERPSLRRLMQQLLSQLDISRDAWNGQWSEASPAIHIDTPSNGGAKEEDTSSLFDVFNTLPSPKPNPEIISNIHVHDAMHELLSGHIDGLKSVLYGYQRRSAALMLQRESSPDLLLDPRLRKVQDQNGKFIYCDTDSGYCLQDPRFYEAVRGGICAETMGLGKTLICLALIVATRHIPCSIPTEYCVVEAPSRKKTGTLMQMAAATIGRTATPWKHRLQPMEGEETELSLCIEVLRNNPGYYHLPPPSQRRESRSRKFPSLPRRVFLSTATLVVVPSNLLEQWCYEIKKHTVGLKVLVVNDMKKRIPPAIELLDFDIILFSKQRFEREARDGHDKRGRHAGTSSRACECPYIGATREPDCTCFTDDQAYQCPLKDVHFKRIIIDEGHTFGNASRSTRTEAITVVDFLRLSARWIISGTPTQGLYGIEVAANNALSHAGVNLSNSSDYDPEGVEYSSETELLSHKQERIDLEKLGNIAITYLNMRPWANRPDDPDFASWSQLVMQPRHGVTSRGNMTCLKNTLEGMIIRHQPADVLKEVVLPPLHHNLIHLEGSMMDKIALNLFSMMIISNAVTSERKDADYLFHPKQRAALQSLFSNLRQASFFWSGYSLDDVRATIKVSKRFLDDCTVSVSATDRELLLQSIDIGETVLSNDIFKAASTYHEIPVYVEMECTEDLRRAWALDEQSSCPTLMGMTMVYELQKCVDMITNSNNPMQDLVIKGDKTMSEALEAGLEQNSLPKSSSKKRKRSTIDRFVKSVPNGPVLAGGVQVGDGHSPKRLSMSAMKSKRKSDAKPPIVDKPEDPPRHLDPHFLTSKIVSTASSKLSYLLDKICLHHESEKILVFYEADNVAYYIAQALEALRIKHLIYAKSLSSDRRSKYVVTFNKTETFRVLLMDVSQAAFGLDLSSASRVFFINPVFSPQVEAQAIKRAHRIGQQRTVYVETLVLRGSIEEAILERRNALSSEQHSRCKTLLDDDKMSEWVRNARHLPLPESGVSGHEQMAKLNHRQAMFGRRAFTSSDPDADLLFLDLNPA